MLYIRYKPVMKRISVGVQNMYCIIFLTCVTQTKVKTSADMLMSTGTKGITDEFH